MYEFNSFLCPLKHKTMQKCDIYIKKVLKNQMGFQIQPIRCNVVNNSVLKTAFVSRFHYPKWPQKQSYPSMFFCAKNQGDQNYFFLNHIFGGSNLIVPHYVIEQIFFLLHKNSFYCITIANFFWAKISKSCSFWSP